MTAVPLSSTAQFDAPAAVGVPAVGAALAALAAVAYWRFARRDLLA